MKIFKRKQNVMRFFDGRYFDLEEAVNYHVNRPMNMINTVLGATFLFALFFAYCLLKH